MHHFFFFRAASELKNHTIMTMFVSGLPLPVEVKMYRRTETLVSVSLVNELVCVPAGWR